jgi:hypothetical protein
MPSFNLAIAGAVAIVGTLAMVGTLVGFEPDAADPVTLPAAAPMAEQPKAPAKAQATDTATTTAAKPVQTAPIPAEPKTIEPRAIAAPSAAQPKPQPASPRPAPVPVRGTGGDRDCTDFGSHEEAQPFFLANGGPSSDPHKLDRDNDGIACESN